MSEELRRRITPWLGWATCYIRSLRGYLEDLDREIKRVRELVGKWEEMRACIDLIVSQLTELVNIDKSRPDEFFRYDIVTTAKKLVDLAFDAETGKTARCLLELRHWWIELHSALILADKAMNAVRDRVERIENIFKEVRMDYERNYGFYRKLFEEHGLI